MVLLYTPTVSCTVHSLGTGCYRKRERETNRERESEEERVFRERGSTFFLKFPAIGPSVSDEARSKVSLHGKEGKREGETNRERESEEERVFRERGSTFSLKFPAIGPSVSGEARSKVSLHGKDYTWVPVLGSFDKLRRKVGVFLLLALLCA